MLSVDVPSVTTPNDWGIPHPDWREYQEETVIWVHDRDGILVAEQPTGSGKSAIAAAQSTKHRTVVLTRTKSLQVAYGDTYGAEVLFGRGNYPCVHEKAIPGMTCDECLYAEMGMSRCPVSGNCIYLNHKFRATKAPFASVNYAYWLAAKGFREAPTGLVVMDECHLLSDLTLEWAGCTLSDRDRLEWWLPQFPKIDTATPEGIEEAIDWLGAAVDILGKQWATLQANGLRGDENSKKQARKAERLGYKLKAALLAMQYVPEDWYLASGPGVAMYRGKPLPGIVIKSLTARYHWRRLFLQREEDSIQNALLMSATIGDFDTFTEELGITEYASRRVPSRYPPETRPVRVLDAPKMGYKSGTTAFDKQADSIAKAIHEYPSDWAGIIHVTRKKEAPLLADRLARRGLQDRVWVPPQKQNGRWLGTQDQMAAWEQRRKEKPDSLCIGWQFWEGVDLKDEKICIAAKCPFPRLGNPYEKARMHYSGKMYLQRTAWQLVQSLGRTRRGRDEDYDLNGEKQGLVAIADGNYRRVQKYLPGDFKEALMEG